MKTQLPVNRPPPAARTKRMTIDSVTSGVIREPHRIFMYGDGGLGKSTFFAEAEGTIFLDSQDGTKKIARAKRFPRPETWQDVLDSIDELLTTNHAYKTFAVDLLDDVEQLIFAHICRRDGHENIEGYGYNKGPTIALVEWRQLLARLERLRREKNMRIGLVGHATVIKFKNPEGEDYGKFGPQINEKASGLIRGWCDTVLFARLESSTKTVNKRTRGISTGHRIIMTNDTAAYYAKNRDNLPDQISLDWSEFEAAVEAGSPADPSAIREEIAGLLTRADDALRVAVEKSVVESGEDSPRLARILNRLRERVPPQQAPTEPAQENAQ